MQDASIQLGTWDITAESVGEYLTAVGDDLPVYMESGAAPPLMLTARVVGMLLDKLSLPDGAIHSLQDVETMDAPAIGRSVSAVATMEPARERGGLRFLTVSFEVSDAEGGRAVQRGKTTVLLPAPSDE